MENQGRPRPLLISVTTKLKLMDPIRRYENVEFIIPANYSGNQLKFPDIPLLRSDTEKDIVIKAMRVYSAEMLPLSYSQNPVATTVDLQSCYLSLYNSGEYSINNIPLPDMLTQYMNDSTDASMWVQEEKKFADIQVDWTKSYIQFAASIAGSGQLSILFGVCYLELLPGTMNMRRAKQAAANAAGIVM